MKTKIKIVLSIFTFVFWSCTTDLTENTYTVTPRATTLEQIMVNGVEFTLTKESPTKVKVRTVDSIGRASKAGFKITIYNSDGSVRLISGSTYFNLLKNATKVENYGLPTGGSASITFT